MKHIEPDEEGFNWTPDPPRPSCREIIRCAGIGFAFAIVAYVALVLAFAYFD